MIKLIKESLNEDMGGVGAPGATLTNVPGMGNATPPSAATGGIGSGDNFGNPINKKPYTQATKGKKKRKVGVAKKKNKSPFGEPKNVSERQSFINFENECPIKEGDVVSLHITSGFPAGTTGIVRSISDNVNFRLNKGWIILKIKDKIKDVKPWDIVINSELKEGNINPYDKFAKMIASQMDHEVEFPFEEVDSATNTVKQKTYDKTVKHESAYTRPTKMYEIMTYEDYVNKLLEEKDTADKESLKYVNGKNVLKEIGISFVFKMIDDKHQIAFIEDDMDEVKEKLEADGWKPGESETEDTGKIDTYTKDGETLSIFTGEFDHPYVTLIKQEDEEPEEGEEETPEEPEGGGLGL